MATNESWRRFEQARRDTVAKLLRTWLRERGRAPEEADVILSALEKWAAWHKRRPGDSRSDAESLAFIPVALGPKAKALKTALGWHARPSTVGGIIASAERWREEIREADWHTFLSVLDTLASATLKNERPRNLRLRSLEGKVLAVFEAADLPCKGSRYAGRILAEIKAHALGTAVPATEDAMRKALRDAVRRRSAEDGTVSRRS